MNDILNILTMTQEEIRQKASNIPGAESIGERDGNILIPGNLPVVFVAHMDTVYHNTPKLADIIIENGKISTKKGCGAGIGGDDRCGCHILFKLSELPEEERPYLLFCSDEETCNGSSVGLNEYDWSFAKAIIEIDAPNYGCYYTDNHSNEVLDEFLSDVIGLIELPTSYNDIHEICKAGNPPGVTIGAGYYNQHDEYSEWISIAGLNASLETAKMVCQNIDKLEWSVVEKKNNINLALLSNTWDYAFEDDVICDPMQGTCYGCDDIDSCEKHINWRNALYGDEELYAQEL